MVWSAPAATANASFSSLLAAAMTVAPIALATSQRADNAVADLESCDFAADGRNDTGCFIARDKRWRRPHGQGVYTGAPFLFTLY